MPTKINKSPFTIPAALIGMGVKGLLGGFGEVLKDRKEAKDAGEDYSFKEGLGDFGRGLASGATGIDFTDEQETKEQPIYTTNINPMTGEEIPMTMMKPRPFKALSPYTASYSAYNMSAKQASKEPLMQELSGVSSLQFTEEGLEKLSAANIGGKFGAIVEAEKNKIKKD
jgi:hypothetical protein